MAGKGAALLGYLISAIKIILLLLMAIVLTLLLNVALMVVILLYFAVSKGTMTGAIDALSDSFNAFWFMLVMTALQDITWVLVAVGFVVLVDRRRFSWGDLGMRFDSGTIKMLATGMGINALLGIATLAAMALTGWQHIDVQGLSTYGPAAVAGSLALTIVLMMFVALGEETLFRGYMQTDLARKYGNLTALIVASLAFALLHIAFLLPGQEVSPLSITGIFCAALVLGYLYIATGTIWASIGFHFFQDVLSAGVFLTGDLPYESQPVFILSGASDITVSGVSLGSIDNLINIVLLLALLGVLYLYHTKARKAKA